MKKLIAVIITVLTSFALTTAYANEGFLTALVHAASNTTSTAPASDQIEVGFSPDEGAENLVLKTIGSAKREIRLLSYSFTSVSITKALLDAKHRGVDVAMIVDYKNNIREDKSGKAKRALNALSNAGVRVRTISIYPIHHDKTIIVDGQHVETGSFNYSDAAAELPPKNSLPRVT